MLNYSWKELSGEKVYVVDDLNKIYPCCFSSLEEAKNYAVKMMSEKDKDAGDMEWHDNKVEEVYIYGRAERYYLYYDVIRVSMLYLNPSAVEPDLV